MRKLLADELSLRLRCKAPKGGRCLRRGALRMDEYIAPAFDQLRQASSSSPHVAAALPRVLRMLVVHAGDAGSEKPLRRWSASLLLLEPVDADGSMLEQDRARLRAVATNQRDAADRGTSISGA